MSNDGNVVGDGAAASLATMSFYVRIEQLGSFPNCRL